MANGIGYGDPNFDASGLLNLGFGQGTIDKLRDGFSVDNEWDKKFASVPNDPTFTSNLGADGNVKSQYKLGAQPDVSYQGNLQNLAANLDPRAMDTYRDYATGTGNSPWAQLMLDQNKANTATAADNAAKTANSGASKAYSELGARGGLRSGAAERIAMDAGRNLNLGRQDAAKTGETNALGIMGQDAAGRVQALQGVSGLDLQKAGLWSQVAGQDSAGKYQADTGNRDYQTKVADTNINNAMQGLNAQNQFNQYIYGQKMAGAGAERTANATENAGKK